jgi:hypothetical protein
MEECIKIDPIVRMWTGNRWLRIRSNREALYENTLR